MSDDTKEAGVYSFLDVQCSIAGPGGSFSLAGMGVSADGIRVTKIGDKNTMTIGAGGAGMHSLHASKAGRISISLLKTGPGNSMLNALYRFQSRSSAFWGQNQFTVANLVTQDSISAINGAFVKEPDNVNATEGGVMVWEFDFPDVDEIIGLAA